MVFIKPEVSSLTDNYLLITNTKILYYRQI